MKINKFFNISLLSYPVFLVFISGFFSCSSLLQNPFVMQPKPSTDTFISWNENRKLSWDDYKGVPDMDLKASAITYCELGFRMSKPTIFHKTKYVVYNNFFPEQSWVKPEFKTDEILLKHEQGHFDLAQVYAKKLNLSLQKKHPAQARKIWKKIYDKYVQAQQRYDRETKYGTDSLQQKKWNEYIQKELSGNP